MSSKMQKNPVEDALLMVAGTGSRLRPLTDNVPKCLIEVAGTPIIIRLLRQLRQSGIKRAHLVTGYLDHVLVEHLSGVPDLPELHFTHNEAYETANNAVSLLSAMENMDPCSFLLCDGDILAPNDAWIRDLVTDPRPNVLAVALQLQGKLGQEEMKVTLEPVDVPWYSRRVVALSKAIQPLFAHGESMGAQIIDKSMFSPLLERLRGMSPAERKVFYYEDVFAQLMTEGHDFYTLAIRPGMCTEIDTVEDLAHAESLMVS